MVSTTVQRPVRVRMLAPEWTSNHRVVVAGVNAGLLLIGGLARRRSAEDSVASLVAGVCFLVVASFGLWLVVIFSFPQY